MVCSKAHGLVRVFHCVLDQWSSTFFGLPPTFNLVGSSPPTSVCKSFFNQEIWFIICMPHVIRLDAKQSAKGLRYLYVARRCHHLWRYTMLSYGQWRREPGRAPGQHNSWPPPYRPTPPPPTKNSNYFVCVCVCVCVCIV